MAIAQNKQRGSFASVCNSLFVLPRADTPCIIENVWAHSLAPLMARSAVASARTDAVVASPHPLWHNAGAVQKSVAAVLTKLEAGVVSGVVQVPCSRRIFLLCVRVHMLVQEREHASLHKS